MKSLFLIYFHVISADSGFKKIWTIIVKLLFVLQNLEMEAASYMSPKQKCFL